MEYINYVKNKAHIGNLTRSQAPVLSEEDEKFLHHVTSDDAPAPPLPVRPSVQDLPVAGDTQGNDAQVALLDAAQNVALPATPDEIKSEPAAMQGSKTDPSKISDKKSTGYTWSWLRRDSRDHEQKVC